MWRSSGSTPSPSRMAEFVTLSLRECPATLWRKLISADCILDLILSIMTKCMALGENRNVDQQVNRKLRSSAQLSLHHNRPAHHPHYCGRCTDPSVDLPLHSPLTCEQDPKILELLHLRQELPSNLKRTCHPFPVENHGLGVGGADLHPNCFTLGCEPPSACCRSWLERASRTTSSAKRRDETHWSPNQTPSGPWLHLEMLSKKVMNRRSDKGKPCRNPTSTGNRSDLCRQCAPNSCSTYTETGWPLLKGP
ncbi:hypothetical protein ILYODFUR_033654 [Ilyodon furcidens]|uniref:Uncharacterized protein n=1 Tax=Ilyodon furcidens TaxID=33524 RepID=A0ABV0ULH8_9TELE